MLENVPTKAFLTKGYGRHKEKLASLELALRDASIAPYNLVKVSSIFPPKCELISKDEGINYLHAGQIVFLVMSENSTNEAYRKIVASVGLAIPNDSSQYGYLSEHHSFGQDENKAGQYVEDLAAYMLASTLGKDYNLDQIWNEEKSIYKISEDVIVKTRNITMTVQGKNGLWTTAVAAAVLIP